MATLTFREFFDAWAIDEGWVLNNVTAFDYFKKQETETDLMFDNADDHCLTSTEMYELYISDEPVELEIHPTPQDYELIFHTEECEEYMIVAMEIDKLAERLGLTIPE